MKVLMIEHFLPGNTYTYELVKELQKLLDVDLLCRQNAGLRADIKSQICVLYPNGINKLLAPFVYGKSLIETRNKVLDTSYQIVHIQTFKSAKNEIPIYRSNKRKAILVSTVHNVFPHEAPDENRQLFKQFYEDCDALVTHNNYSKSLLIKEFGIPEEKIAVIPHGIYGEAIELAQRKDETMNFLVFGGIRDYKGIDILLEAISLLSYEVLQKCRFTIAGKQYNNTDYIAMAEKFKISQYIDFQLRRIPDEEIRQLYEDCDACIFPYKEIYGSGALLMAYTYLKPVIASNVPAFVEETDEGKTGLLFESENPQSLADKITLFVKENREAHKEYSRKIRELVDFKYNWANSAQLTVQLYRTLLDKVD